MVHTSFASKVASTMERERALHRTNVHASYGQPTPGASHRRRRATVGQPTPPLPKRRSRLPGSYADLRAPFAPQRREAVRAPHAAPEESRLLREIVSLPRLPATNPETGAPGIAWRVPNRVLVRFRSDVRPGARQEILRAAGARVREELADGELLIEFEPTAAGSAAARRLASTVAVEMCRRVMVIAVGYEAQQEEAVAAEIPARAMLAGVR